MNQDNIVWVDPKPLVAKQPDIENSSVESLNPTAYLHSLHQQTTCCAGALDDYIATIQRLLQTCSECTQKSTDIHKGSTNEVLLSILDYSESVDQLLNRFSQIESSVSGLAELNAEVKELRKKIETLEVVVKRTCFKK
ncbi:BLOC-1-related complex subunit 6 C-terminal helix domain-containing protein [Entamoeba marina]